MRPNYDPDGKISRTAYIIQAMVEYFVTLLTSGTFLTNLLNYLEFSTASQGIISAVASLMLSAELVAVLAIRKRTGIKRMVIFMNILTQLFFCLIYFTPLFNIPSGAKSALFIVLLVTAYLFWYLSTPFKNAWLMSNVRNDLRGIFTAKKEIVSLVGGMAFTFVMGRIVDYYDAIGDMTGSFVVCGIVAFGFGISNTVCLIFTKEKKPEFEEKLPGFRKNFIRSWNVTMMNPGFRKVILISMVYYIAHSITFYNGTFQRNYLGMSMTFVSVLGIVSALSRALVSMPIGNYADRHGWTKMMGPCFLVAMGASVINAFSGQTIGVVTHTIYFCLNAMALGGMNSGMFNITFEYVDEQDRTDAIAWQYTIGGIVGFLASLGMSAIVDAIEANGNVVLGIAVFPQQVLAVIGAALYLILALIMFNEARGTRF